MRYVILKVRDPEKEYFVLNNQYIGYVGFDSVHLRSRIENRAQRLHKKRKFVVYAYSESNTDSEELHIMNCSSLRMSKLEADELILAYAFRKTNSRTWLRISFPSRRSSKIVLINDRTNRVVYNESFFE